MSEELFSYGYYEGTTGDLLLVSTARNARCLTVAEVWPHVSLLL